MLRRENIVMLMDDEKKVQEEWIVSGDNKGESVIVVQVAFSLGCGRV